jgi:hypothetical protein
MASKHKSEPEAPPAPRAEIAQQADGRWSVRLADGSWDAQSFELRSDAKRLYIDHYAGGEQ